MVPKAKKRSFLMLQGPIGPFFDQLSQKLQQDGHSVKKINFWLGDEYDFKTGIPFKDNISNWETFLIKTLSDNRVTDLVLFGDRRPYHELAIETVAAYNDSIRVWVFEEGYMRPDWITLEHFGANWRSSLPRTKHDYVRLASELKEVNLEHVSFGPWMKEALPSIITHYAIGLVGYLFYPNFKKHRTHHILSEAFGWTTKWLMSNLGIRNEANMFESAESYLGQHFLLPLQLSTDAQVKKYSRFSDMPELMKFVMNSFKTHAPSDSKLVVKIHPLEHRWKYITEQFEKIRDELGLRERVAIVDGCSASDITKGCRGVVTINSTFGLYAIEHGIPVKTLGNCFWAFEGMVDTNPIEAFWENPKKPDAIVYDAFKKVVLAKTQINGGFYSEKGRQNALKMAVQRLATENQDTQRLGVEPSQRRKQRKKEPLGSAPGVNLRPRIDVKV